MHEFLQVMVAVFRHRPPTVDEFTELVAKEGADPLAVLDEAIRLGFLDRRNDRLFYRHPELAVGEAHAGILVEHATVLTRLEARSNDLVRTLPELRHAWEAGRVPAQLPRSEVFSGPRAALDSWKTLLAQSTPGHIDLCLPALEPLLKAAPPGYVASWSDSAAPSRRLRTLISISDAQDPVFGPLIDRVLADGHQVRMHPEPPGLFWVSDVRTIAIPLDWEETWPSGMLASESIGLATILSRHFAQLWESATPVSGARRRPRTRGWDPILKLMNQGHTIEAASGMLGYASRTGRRRIAEAMEHYGVSGQFALGAAWGADRALAGDRD